MFPNPWLLEKSKSGKYHTESLLQEVLLSIAMEVFCKFDSRHSKFFQGKFLWWTSISGWIHATCYLAFRKCPPWDFLLFLEREDESSNCLLSYVCTVKHQKLSQNGRTTLPLSWINLFFSCSLFVKPNSSTSSILKCSPYMPYVFAPFKTPHFHSQIPFQLTS